MPPIQVPPRSSPRIGELLSASEIAALRTTRDRLAAVATRFEPERTAHDVEWNADLDAMKTSIAALTKIIDAKPCSAHWTAGLLSPPGEVERPTGWCELAADHNGLHLFPNGNRQP